jgi:hypothetical protein
MTAELKEKMKKYLIGDVEQIWEGLAMEYLIGRYYILY